MTQNIQRGEPKLIFTSSAVENGEAVNMPGTGFTAQLVFSGSANMTSKIQGSMNGTSWTELASNVVTGDGTAKFDTEEVWAFIRGAITARSGGTLNLYVMPKGY